MSNDKHAEWEPGKAIVDRAKKHWGAAEVASEKEMIELRSIDKDCVTAFLSEVERVRLGYITAGMSVEEATTERAVEEVMARYP